MRRKLSSLSSGQKARAGEGKTATQSGLFNSESKAKGEREEKRTCREETDRTDASSPPVLCLDGRVDARGFDAEDLFARREVPATLGRKKGRETADLFVDASQTALKRPRLGSGGRLSALRWF